ncbi:MAG: hypothetical protein J2P36_37885, partial [Ktedonobacteraceae bacterium]|nr:hypothetical protein [Ktedonobacteraceae bacterium]
ACFVTSCIVLPNIFSFGSLNLMETLMIVAIPLLLLLSSIVGLLKLTKNLRKVKARVAEEQPRWEQAMANWSSLYWCARDAIIFFPDSGRYAQSDEIGKLL